VGGIHLSSTMRMRRAGRRAEAGAPLAPARQRFVSGQVTITRCRSLGRRFCFDRAAGSSTEARTERTDSRDRLRRISKTTRSPDEQVEHTR